MDFKNTLTASIQIYKPIGLVWKIWNEPEHIATWNAPSDEWINKKIENNLVEGGGFLYVMAKKDGTENFDFRGTYTEIIAHERIAYTLDDERKSLIIFTGNNPVTLTEIFEPVAGLDLTMQQEFCQSGLNQLKAYAEQLS
ncbi:SRPBCC domain-containing protein [Pedobacter sp. ISL-68]|uniref:SRPBCC domain-containing protein n=1 Tax=unclassified Pedobacter TaxID=2628915 RepID=UPI001BE93666|nr:MULTISPECIES: SRPBCC domain-containing protein [unclassified Pedobacter]MBT2561808.1 SRPBCC domain-containing protein [Pedobacter sp. ISL-64]MBT2591196.1 SRPBCC domain-containing protein [Pedobacter sp. ISL-68]